MDIIPDIMIMREYPKATLALVKGKWYVQVTIPTDLRPAFKGHKQKRLSTGTSDQREAERRLHGKASEIYASFDAVAKTFDPVADAADQVSFAMNHAGWQPAAWSDKNADDAAYELRTLATVAMNPDFVTGLDPEDSAAANRMAALVEDRLGVFEAELAKRAVAQHVCQTKYSKVTEEYIASVTFARHKTEDAYRRGAKKFEDFAGDLPVGEVTRQTAVAFRDHLAESLSYNTLQRDIGCVRRVFVFAHDKGWIPANPFDRLSLKGKGRAPVKRTSFRRSQLETLFGLPLTEQDRLCLTMLAATGMRLDEAALLHWQDIRTEGGITYFDLDRIGKIIKNPTASRAVPVPSSVRLPPVSSGRFFSYRLDRDQKAENAASKALMRHVRRVRDDVRDPRLTVHSLRHTYRDLLGDAGVPEEIGDYIVGHKGVGQGRSYGAGPSLRVKLENMERVDLSFLKVA